ncbi:MAG: arsenosugar biosynthesis radical SAM protein ArsS [Gammaproteobacteria bacterium]|nr:arsenosugar biosynthesis radical SAM protein ArsS [Gammaproteobacteria bacterium]
MRAMLPLLHATDFPAIQRGKLKTLQINIGYRCNQACFHCHVNAGPDRKEAMDTNTIQLVLDVLKKQSIKILDITGGAPELHPHFRTLVERAHGLDVKIIDRCNLTVLEEEGQKDTAEFLAGKQVEIVASLPCYLEDNVNAQRGNGVFQTSIKALQKLNALGYAKENSGLVLNLVYNPQGPSLPPSQTELQAAYKKELKSRYNIDFNQLFTITNMPIARFGSTLVTQGKFNSYMQLLKSAHSDENLAGVMCRELISVDYRGYLYDCDFNQMLGIPLGGKRKHIKDLLDTDFAGKTIAIADHCYGCTAGQGSSCGGALGH